MIILYVGALILLCIPLPITTFSDRTRNGFWEEYLSPQKTTVIKGFFVLLIMISHFSSYVSYEPDIGDKLFQWVDTILGQFPVTMFWFYSGYGICYKIMNSGEIYLKSFFSKRLFPVWLSFAICVSFFAIQNLVLGIKDSAYQLLAAFIGWESIGNSNWYMFDTFAVYLGIIMTFRNGGSRKRQITLFCIYVSILIVVLYFAKGRPFYDTVICFPFGMLYYYHKDRFERIIKSNYNAVFLLLLLAVLISRLLSMFVNYLFFLICGPLFCLLVVMITMKLEFSSGFCRLLGEHVFSVYIIQRLWFRAFHSLSDNRMVYFILAAACTVGSAVLYDFCFSQVKYRIIAKTN